MDDRLTQIAKRARSYAEELMAMKKPPRRAAQCFDAAASILNAYKFGVMDRGTALELAAAHLQKGASLVRERD